MHVPPSICSVNVNGFPLKQYGAWSALLYNLWNTLCMHIILTSYNRVSNVLTRDKTSCSAQQQRNNQSSALLAVLFGETQRASKDGIFFMKCRNIGVNWGVRRFLCAWKAAWALKAHHGDINLYASHIITLKLLSVIRAVQMCNRWDIVDLGNNFALT